MDINLLPVAESIATVGFGGVAGIVASTVRTGAVVAALAEKISILEKKVVVLETMDNSSEKQLEELKQQISNVVKYMTHQIDAKFSTVTTTMVELMKSTSEMHRSLGAIEGMLNMIAQNGCARVNRCE